MKNDGIIHGKSIPGRTATSANSGDGCALETDISVIRDVDTEECVNGAGFMGIDFMNVVAWESTTFQHNTMEK